MSDRSRAALVVAGVLAALALMPAGPGSRPDPGSGAAARPGGAPSPGWDGTVTLIGDGSTADTGPQPAQPSVGKLKPGEQPPQFVVFSWDGAVEDDSHLLSDLRAAARRDDARMTFFLRGADLLPAAKRSLYQPPQHQQGAAAAPPLTDGQIAATLTQIGQGWQDGDEIATAFNGQFCGPKGGASWSTAEWQSEIDQAYSFVGFWKTNTGLTDLPPLPFDYQKELTGGRAPCLEGSANLRAAEQSYGWRYDTGSAADTPRWPQQADGLWEFPVLSHPDQAVFEHAYRGSRAPLLIDTRLDAANAAAAVHATEELMGAVCHRDGVRCVSFRQLADWLDAQDPSVLARLRSQ